MAESEKDQAGQEAIAKGMAEAGKDKVKSGGEAGRGGAGHGAGPGHLTQGNGEAGKDEVKGGGEAGGGGPGHGADPGKLTRGMAEAGSGAATGAGAPSGESPKLDFGHLQNKTVGKQGLNASSPLPLNH